MCQIFCFAKCISVQRRRNCWLMSKVYSGPWGSNSCQSRVPALSSRFKWCCSQALGVQRKSYKSYNWQSRELGFQDFSKNCSSLKSHNGPFPTKHICTALSWQNEVGISVHIGLYRLRGSGTSGCDQRRLTDFLGPLMTSSASGSIRQAGFALRSWVFVFRYRGFAYLAS